MAHTTTVEQRVAAKIKSGERFRLPEAIHYLRSKRNFTTEVQLRNWHSKGLLPGYQPVKGSPLLLDQKTLDQIIAGKLPA